MPLCGGRCNADWTILIVTGKRPCSSSSAGPRAGRHDFIGVLYIRTRELNLAACVTDSNQCWVDPKSWAADVFNAVVHKYRMTLSNNHYARRGKGPVQTRRGSLWTTRKKKGIEPERPWFRGRGGARLGDADVPDLGVVSKEPNCNVTVMSTLD